MEGSGNTPNRPYETLLYALSGTSAVTVIFGFEGGNRISEKPKSLQAMSFKLFARAPR